MKKKTFALVSILILGLTTLGGSIVAAETLNQPGQAVFLPSLFSNRNRVSLDDLMETYEDLTQAKQDYRQLLESYGIELPDLTKEEKQDIIKTIRELRRNGAEREKIREEIVDKLIDFGVDLPNLSTEQRLEIRTQIKTYLETEWGFTFIELSAEQRAYIKQNIIQMKRNEATKEEIKTEIISLYEQYGGVIPKLTDPEKEIVHDWIITMLKTDYDLSLPDLTADQRETLKEQKQEIHQLQKELRTQFRQANWFTRIRFLRQIK